MTCLTAVIGDPIQQSLSPTIANAAYKALNLDWKMLGLKVPEGESQKALEVMRHLKMAGISVTMPHKKSIAQNLDILEESAAALGAVNCVVLRDDKLVGHNTDGEGFLFSLASEGVGLEKSRILIFGAGGASLAVARACLQAGAQHIGICARSKAEQLAEKLGHPVEPVDASSCLDFDILINATPLGMEHLKEESPIEESKIQKSHIVVDLVYNPEETKLIKLAKQKGAKTIGGLGMLVGQAVEAIRLWTGLEPDSEIMTSAARASSILKNE